MATVMETAPQAPPGRAGAHGGGDRRFLFVGLAVASIWIATAMASLFTPDMVTGSQHDHLPIAALSDWMYAALATALVLLAAGMNAARDPERSPWLGFLVAIAGIWLAVAVASIYGPELVTGTDPTRIPMAALVSPVAGLTGTAFLSVVAAGWRGRG